MIDRSEIDAAKERVRIPELWRILNLSGEPPSRDGVKFSSPLRPDRHPSCSFDDGCRLMSDWSAGQHYDAIKFLGAALGLQNGEATKRFLEIASGHKPSIPAAPVPHSVAAAKPHPQPDLSAIRPCSDAELLELALLRSIPLIGLRLARERNLLFSYSDRHDGRCWLITDDARRSAIKRRFDGKPFEYLSGKFIEDPDDWKKTKNFYGSDANWPIGIAQANGFRSIALCEGTPDFLAAFALACADAVELLCSPVCMTGAGCSIHVEALQMFRGKRVRIFGHDDEAGREAVRKWADQLRSVQANVDAFEFSGLVKADDSPVNDLNDFLLVDHERSGVAAELVRRPFWFALDVTK